MGNLGTIPRASVARLMAVCVLSPNVYIDASRNLYHDRTTRTVTHTMLYNTLGNFREGHMKLLYITATVILHLSIAASLMGPNSQSGLTYTLTIPNEPWGHSTE